MSWAYRPFATRRSCRQSATCCSSRAGIVDRVEDIDGLVGGNAPARFTARIMAVVEAHQHIVANGAGVEVAAQVIVEQERIGFLRAFLVAEGVSPAVGTQLAAVASTVADVVDVDLHVAGVLGEFPVVVQLALEEVAERGVPHLVLAHVRIAR